MLTAALKSLFKALLYIGKTFCNAGVKPEANIEIDFDDGFIIDTEHAKENDRQDIRDGIMQLWEYRAKWYGETEEEAKAAVEGMQTARENPFGFE